MTRDPLDLDAVAHVRSMIHSYDGGKTEWIMRAENTLDALLARVRELEAAVSSYKADRELLDYMEQQGTVWSKPPMRAVRGTEWAVRAEHDIGDTPTLREVLRIARTRTDADGGIR